MTTIAFCKFRTDFTNAINPNKYKISYPNNSNDLFFWITSLGTGIGAELCHYEFVAENNKTSNTMVNLEIHFEFSTSQDSLLQKRVLDLKKLFGKRIEYRYTNNTQVGVKYAEFDTQSSNVINEAIATFEEMDKLFKRKMPLIIIKLMVISIFKKKTKKT